MPPSKRTNPDGTITIVDGQRTLTVAPGDEKNPNIWGSTLSDGTTVGQLVGGGSTGAQPAGGETKAPTASGTAPAASGRFGDTARVMNLGGQDTGGDNEEYSPEQQAAQAARALLRERFGYVDDVVYKKMVEKFSGANYFGGAPDDEKEEVLQSLKGGEVMLDLVNEEYVGHYQEEFDETYERIKTGFLMKAANGTDYEQEYYEDAINNLDTGKGGRFTQFIGARVESGQRGLDAVKYVNQNMEQWLSPAFERHPGITESDKGGVFSLNKTALNDLDRRRVGAKQVEADMEYYANQIEEARDKGTPDSGKFLIGSPEWRQLDQAAKAIRHGALRASEAWLQPGGGADVPGMTPEAFTSQFGMQFVKARSPIGFDGMDLAEATGGLLGSMNEAAALKNGAAAKASGVEATALKGAQFLARNAPRAYEIKDQGERSKFLAGLLNVEEESLKTGVGLDQIAEGRLKPILARQDFLSPTATFSAVGANTDGRQVAGSFLGTGIGVKEGTPEAMRLHIEEGIPGVYDAAIKEGRDPKLAAAQHVQAMYAQPGGLFDPVAQANYGNQNQGPTLVGSTLDTPEGREKLKDKQRDIEVGVTKSKRVRYGVPK